MKISLLILLLVVVQASASVFPQNNYLSLTTENKTMREVFRQIESETNYRFFYNDEFDDLSKQLSFNLEGHNINELLDIMLLNSNVTYRILDENVVVITPHSYVQQQITGRVTDAETGEGLPAASIVIEGTVTGVITNADGYFEINVQDEDAVLEFSYIGYTTQRVTVGDQRVINVALQTDLLGIDEVVVTALGIEREAKALSYNVQRIGSEALVEVRDANFVNSLVGRIAGVTINTSSAGIGGASRVIMRGTTSIAGNNNALYVIDGIPLLSHASDQVSDLFSGAGQSGDGISNFNPDDIESVSILSGPAAAALYGSEAANGVVMITTKRGQSDTFSVNLSSQSSFYSPFVMPKFQNRYGSEVGSYYSWGDKLETPSSYDPADFFQTGYNVTNSVSVSTGTSRNQTFLSAATVNAQGIINNNDLDRYNISFRNTSSLLDDNLTLDLSARYMKIQEQNMISQGQYFNPLIPIYLFPRGDDITKYQVYERYNLTRNFKTQFWPFGDLGFQVQNPYWITQRNMFNNDKDRYLVNVGLSYDINDWLSISGRTKLDVNTNVNERNYYASTAGLFAGPAGAYYKYNTNARQIYADGLLTMNRYIGDFSIDANLGASYRDVVYEHSSFGGDLVSVPNVFTYSNVNLSQAQVFQNSYNDQTQAVYATAQVGFKGMVYLDVTGRNDWVSALANTNANSIFYPSFGLSGIITDLFNINSDVLSFLKARASYSEVGNAPMRYISIPTYAIFDGFPQTHTALPARDLEPERTNSVEAGVEARLWGNKLRVDATVYQSSTYNQLFNPSLSASSGYSSFYVNAGRIDNKGIEASIFLNQGLGGVTWNSGLIFSLNRNKIVELLPAYTVPLTGETVALSRLDMGGTGSYRMELVEGGSMGDIYVTTLRTDEKGYIWVEPNSQAVSPNHTALVKAGNANPKYNLGFSNRFTYNNFDLNFLVNARVGGVGVSVTQAIMDAFGVSEASARARDEGGALVNGYRIPSQPYYQTVGGGVAGVGSMYVYSATNVRLAEVSIGYDIPVSSVLNWAQGVNISLVGRNLFMFYNKAPFDPESTASTGTYYQGIDYFMQPSLRSFGFAVNVRL